MNMYERAAQGWSLLAFAAQNQKILSYRMVGNLTGVPRVGVGQFLGPIQSYCQKNNLPPLTSIVVLEETGLPGDGFTAATDVQAAQARVFLFDWMGRAAPTVEELQQAYKAAAAAA